jgi:hypothetical protein
LFTGDDFLTASYARMTELGKQAGQEIGPLVSDLAQARHALMSSCLRLG